MIQNIITLIIVFLALAYTIHQVISGLLLKKASKCEGCPGCRIKESIVVSRKAFNN